jgi:hypothetical protein
MDTLPFRSLLYRYFFYGWLFRDATRGNVLERAASMCHNRGQARWLPLYLRRMLVVGALLLSVAAYIELVLGWPLASAWFYLATAMTVPYDIVTGVCWVFLTQRPPG